jgi:N-acetylglucosamine-6-phosphate deacetylase
MPQLVARRYDTLRPIALEMEGERIAQIAPTEGQPGLPIVAPGLVDLQINGFGGVEFNDSTLTVEKVRQVAVSQDAFGVTSLLATCTTDSHAVLRHALATIARTIRELPEVAARIPGIHLEGPFISPEDGPRGAHPRRMRPPDWDEFCKLQDAAEGLIVAHDLAEYDS